jgi:hypothetical protein
MVLVAFTATQNDIMVVRLNAVSWDVLDGDSGVHYQPLATKLYDKVRRVDLVKRGKSKTGVKAELL